MPKWFWFLAGFLAGSVATLVTDAVLTGKPGESFVIQRSPLPPWYTERQFWMPQWYASGTGGLTPPPSYTVSDSSKTIGAANAQVHP
jgi:hypothetical protein